MKKNHLYVMTAAMLMISSCVNEVPNGLSKPDNVIRIVTNIAPQSRVPQLANDGSGNFSDGDKMSLFITDENENCFSVEYEYGSCLTWDSLCIDEVSKQITLAACYPVQEEQKNGIFEFNTLTATEKDLLLAPAQSVSVGTNEDIYLNFEHALHYMELTFIPGMNYTDDEMETLSVTLKAKASCIVDAKQGKIIGTNNSTGEYTSTGTRATFYLVPQKTADVVLNITLGNDKKSLTLDKLLEQMGSQQSALYGGKSCKLTLKVSREGITVEGGSINGWDNQVTADGEVVLG